MVYAVPTTALPLNIREGDKLTNGRIDPLARKRMEARIEELHHRLYGD